MINLNKDTLFNEDDQEEKKGKKEKKEEELDLEEEDILPIEETGGGGRKILWTIVVLIIIGLGIYSFAKREQIREGLKTPKEEKEEIAESAKDTTEEFTWKGPEEKEEGKVPTVEEGEGKIIKEAALPQLEEFTAGEEKREIAQTETPAAEKEAEAKITVEEDKFIATAGKGEGITHLARRALAEYLEKSGRQQEVNNEQKIFIEDYLQNRTGGEWLSQGEERTFTVGQISEAIDASKKLNEKQLQNLEKYSQIVFGS